MTIGYRRANEDDYRLINEWYANRGMVPVPRHWFPETTWIAIVNKKPVVSKSLLLTNSVYAMSEYAISDPNSDPRIRKEAILFLNDMLLQEAKKFGFECVVMFSNMERTWEKASESGFQVIGEGYKMLMRSV